MSKVNVQELKILANAAIRRSRGRWEARYIVSPAIAREISDHVTAASPVTVIALCDEIERLKANLKEFSNFVTKWSDCNIESDFDEQDAYDSDLERVLPIARAALQEAKS